MGLSGRRIGPGVAAGAGTSPMTHRTWIGRLLAPGTHHPERAAWRTRLLASPTLQPLPERDGPSSLAGAEDGLLLGMNPGGPLRSPASFAAEPPPATTNRPGTSPVLPPVGGRPRDTTGGARGPATDDHRTEKPSDPLAAFAPPAPGADFFSYGPVDVPGRY